ncbi:uncharacterized protein LOC129959233 [Argiope bruennichi]|uniref:Uncharacterized protein n=1 Tax=Argiope bruennichi TaxID=94029 RepID=A0A8T0F6A9_ARGBR|nr:uncharacterized protein LOC129959233 [Argiope bruennichi]KAF8784950.1 hypothetical protein HNY73_010557 [Argiope bruennichi]
MPEEKMVTLKFLMFCLVITTLSITVCCGNNASFPPRHISEFSDPVSGFNPFIDLMEGFMNDSRPSQISEADRIDPSFSEADRIDRKAIGNRWINVLSAMSVTESERKSNSSNEQSKITNTRVYDSINKTETLIKKLISIDSQPAMIPSDKHLKVNDSINETESIRKKLIAKESQQQLIPSETHLNINDAVNNEESVINELIPEKSQNLNLTTVSIESETTESVFTTKKVLNKNGNDDLEGMNFRRKWKKIRNPNNKILENEKLNKQYKSFEEIHFPAVVNPYAYAIYAIACSLVIFVIILYIAISIKRKSLLLIK